jgi:hypothetical protein
MQSLAECQPPVQDLAGGPIATRVHYQDAEVIGADPDQLNQEAKHRGDDDRGLGPGSKDSPVR